jgi:DNA repair protein RadD
MILRPYQTEALDTVWAALLRKPNVLLQAATGAGKTIIFSTLIQRFITRYPKAKVAVLAHRKELVNQAYQKLKSVWPEAFYNVGIACAGLGEVRTNHPVVIGTVQTLARRALTSPFNLMIIDEIHRVAPIRDDNQSQYQKLIERCRDKRPTMRLLGVTATPFRLNQGLIYGSDTNKWFDSLDYQISLDDLIASNYLVPLSYKVIENLSDDEINKVKVERGDYKNNQLSDLMCKEYHLESVVKTYLKYGENRKHCCVFACSIQHAEAIKKVLLNYGYNADAVHSKLPDNDRDRIIRDFENGKIDFIINVGILTEGWDSPLIDVIIMARPTLSPGLYVQMVGRGTRLSEGKENLLVLDIVGNYLMHGPPGSPIVRDGKEPVIKDYKVCPRCQAPVSKTEYTCPDCGFEWEKPEEKEDVIIVDKDVGKLIDVNVSRKFIESKVSYWDANKYISAKNNLMIRLMLNCVPGGVVNSFLDIEGNGSEYGQQKARQLWRKLANSEPPDSVSEAVERLGELNIPSNVKLYKDGKYLRVSGW